MHEVSNLGIRIREIKLEIVDVAEIFEDLDEGFLAILLLDPIPDLLSSLVLALLPDTDVKGDREQAFGFGIVLVVCLVPLLPGGALNLPGLELGSVPGPLSGIGVVGRGSRLGGFSAGGGSDGAIYDPLSIGNQEGALHFGSLFLVLFPIEMGNVVDVDGGFVGRHGKR